MQNLGLREKALENFLEMIQSLPDSDDGKPSDTPTDIGDDKGKLDILSLSAHPDDENSTEDANETPGDEKEEELGTLISHIIGKGK